MILSEDDLENVLSTKREECESLEEYHVATRTTGKCDKVWDGIMCWPSENADHLSSQPCPQYFPGLESSANATKRCTENGTWYVSPETQHEWTNYSQCYVGEETVIFVPVPSVNSSTFKEYLPVLKRISQLGYGASLSALVVAFLVLVAIKKLHCSRNILHLHLFMSFIMKAVITFLKETLFQQGVGLQSDFAERNGTAYFIEKTDRNWECKALTTVWQYFIMANYSWILMEGLYMHNLIVFAPFRDGGSIRFYAAFGWGLPVVFVIWWVFVKIKFENEFCWTTRTDSIHFMIIKVPIIISILDRGIRQCRALLTATNDPVTALDDPCPLCCLVPRDLWKSEEMRKLAIIEMLPFQLSFILFLDIVAILLIKIRSSIQRESQRYWKWAKSTLILIPLFGVHYAVFHGMSYSRGDSEGIELVWLFCDQFFASFQGFFVALLFCFLNTEIQTEIKRKWRKYIRKETTELVRRDSAIPMATLRT